MKGAWHGRVGLSHLKKMYVIIPQHIPRCLMRNHGELGVEMGVEMGSGSTHSFSPSFSTHSRVKFHHRALVGIFNQDS